MKKLIALITVLLMLVASSVFAATQNPNSLSEYVPSALSGTTAAGTATGKIAYDDAYMYFTGFSTNATTTVQNAATNNKKGANATFAYYNSQ
ncbi:hypothetical protein [Desulfovibrio gilichinskyi]|uniref:Uncharacterized protein n=1 Tax=Desulfovibrio gilichinskyi TaxID=1519643 RepID=A0A1X7EHB1_9BACT|nr:hypothetical protein [Desulfovibrio gilichinskyi]SMF33896.1 hypothetical protein SAMN06295933_2937 [Desulfovibrio gilichinskyi]